MVSAIIGAGINAISQADTNYQNLKRTETDRQLNYIYGERAAEEADRRTRALYNDFYSPEALVRQYNEAGLSPSLMFGGTPGQGGMQGAHGTGAAGPQTAPYMPYSIVEAAQAAALFAQAEKTKEETKTITGDNDRGAAEIANILANTGNVQAQTNYTNLMSTFQSIENYVAENTKDMKIDEVEEQVELLKWQAKQMKWTARNSKLEFDINNATAADRIKLIHEQVGNIIADTALKITQKELTEEQKKEVREHIRYMSGMLQISKEDLNNKTFMIDYERSAIEANIKYQQEMIEYLNKQLGINDNNADWSRFTDIMKGVLQSAMQIGMMYYLKGAGGAKAVMPPIPYKGVNANGGVY